MATQNILASATGAGTSDTVEVIQRPMTVSAFGTLGANTGALEKLASDDSTWMAVYKDGSAVTLSATAPQYTIYGGGQYRVVFSARAAAIGVDVDLAPLA